MNIPLGTDQVQGPAIHVQGLEKSYKELRVLRGVDLDVGRGEVLALLGSNGAGKTTMVRILSTLLKADAGTARVNGFDVGTQAADVRASISLTGQFTAVDEILSGRENLVLVARLRHLKNPGTIADGLLRRFSLAEAGDRRVAAYSGGMRRRLDIAMSLIGNPPVVFLDEPTTGLDPEARIEVWQSVKELAEGGTTVLLTTQYLDEAEHLADRIAILHRGRIIVNDTLAGLRRLLPPAKVEYVEKQPSLEDIFLALVGDHSDHADTSEPVDTSEPDDTGSPIDTSTLNDTSNTIDAGKRNDTSDTSKPGNTASPSNTNMPNPRDTGKPNDTAKPGDTGKPRDTANSGDAANSGEGRETLSGKE